MRARATFRNAIAVSVGVHTLLAAGVVFLLTRQPPPAVRPRLDTRVDIRFEIPGEELVKPEVVLNAPPESPSKPAPTEPPPASPAEAIPAGPPKALAIELPSTLPSELLALLRKPSAPAAPPSPTTVAQAGATVPKQPAWAGKGSPVHGPLDPKQAIVYVLDASGSMGEWAKFNAARAALIATLRLQPATVRFQIVIYSGTAAPLFREPECRPATAENIARAIELLEALPAPAGRSQHLEGLRTALRFRPDLVLFVTDADDLPATALRGIIRQADLPAKLCMSKVTANGVAMPAEVK